MVSIHFFRLKNCFFVEKNFPFSLRSKTCPYVQWFFPSVPLLLWFVFGLVCSVLLKVLFCLTKFHPFQKLVFLVLKFFFDCFHCFSQMNINESLWIDSLPKNREKNCPPLKKSAGACRSDGSFLVLGSIVLGNLSIFTCIL